MQLRYKVVLLGGVPLLLAAGLLAFVVEREGTALATSQIAQVAPVLRKAKEDQLVRVVELALNAVQGLDDPAIDGKAVLEQLRTFTFGTNNDGYFYVYEMGTGICLMNQQSRMLENLDQSNLRDDRGQLVMPPLYAAAERGGDFVEYRWKRPSQQNSWRPKLGYVVRLPRRNWLLGTGVYVDDLEASLTQLRGASTATIRSTMIGIAVIAVLSVLVVAVGGLLLNVNQQRLADSRLQRLTRQVVTAQEAERARVSRFLHDEAVQELLAIRYVLETALVAQAPDPPVEAHTRTLQRCVTGLAEVIEKIRVLARGVRTPSHGDDLSVLLVQLGTAFATRTRIAVAVDTPAERPALSADAATVLYRIAEQALGNIERHAGASEAEVQLATSHRGGSMGTRLTVRDNGRGFDVAAAESRPGGGVGLLNMRERLEALGGKLAIQSSAQGTAIEAFLPDGATTEDGNGDDDSEV